MALGILLVRGSRKMVQWFGGNATIERYLGAGGTYTFYKIAGILLFFGGIFYMFDLFGRILHR